MEQSKSIFRSRIVWVNLAAAALEVLQLATDAQVLPPGRVSLIANVASILLRRVTAGEVHVVTPRPVDTAPKDAEPVPVQQTPSSGV